MAATAASYSRASAAASKIAFQESIGFATEVGAARAKMACIADQHDPISILQPLIKGLLKHAERHIRAWHSYLSVKGLHSEGSLRAAFATVSENTKGFSGLRNMGEHLLKKSPRSHYWTAAGQAKLTQALKDLEDIQENLAILIDDDARGELKSILEEAGIDGRPLDRKDAEASRTTAD